MSNGIDGNQAELLSEPISIFEVVHAMENAPLDRAPGDDGIPAETWKHFTRFAPLLARDFNSWLDQESLPQSVNMGIITLLYKTKTMKSTREDT